MSFTIYAASEDDSSKYDNVYAIARDGRVHVASRHASISLSHMNDIFAETLVNERMREIYGDRPSDPTIRDAAKQQILGRKRVVEDRSGNYYIERIGGVDAAMQFLVDIESGVMYNVASSFPVGPASPEENRGFRDLIMKSVREWVSDNHSIDDIPLAPNDAPLPEMDYRIFKISDFPGVINYIKRNGLPLSLTGNEVVLMADCSKDNMLAMAREQLGYENEDMLVEDGPFIYTDGERDIIKLEPPFYFINTAGKSVVSASRALIKFLVDHSFVTSLMEQDDMEQASDLAIGYLYSSSTMDMDVGKSLGEIMHTNILGSVEGRPNLAGKVRIGQIDDTIDAFGASDDPQMSQFIKSFMAMISAFPPYDMGNGSYADRYGQYYYLAKRPDELRYDSFFNKIFTVVSTVTADSGEVYDILFSIFSIPLAALRLFGYEGAMVSTYNEKMKVIMRSLEHTSEQSRDRERYMQTLAEMPHEISSSMGDIFSEAVGKFNPEVGSIETHIDKPGSAKMISEYPMVFARVKEMFSAVGMEFHDIPVTLVYDRERPGVGGSYSFSHGSKAYFDKEDNIFSPPEITLNIINMKDMDAIADVLIHEASHFIDDLMTAKGLEPSDFMSKSPSGEGADYWRQYLHGDPTEFTAHLMQCFTNLRFIGREYTEKNIVPLKMSFINTYMPETTKQASIVENASRGDTELFVDNPTTLQDGMQYDIAGTGEIENYINNGVKDHFTIEIISVDDSQSKVTFAPPLPKDLPAGHSIWFPTVGPHDIRGTREELYGDIIDKAFEYYLKGGDLPRGV
jgi:hypothetical protein